MIENKLSKLSGEVTRASLFLTRNLSSSIAIERSLEKKSLDLKRKIVEDRGRILKRIGSRDRDSQRGGLLGGALGLLGIGGGGGLFRRGLRRTPRSPSQLLRMQKGTSNLSRVGRLGRLARPIAAVGTGLDFIGRRAEGQTNVQAGVGAAGGLAGSIAFAKGGALLGTAIAGPLGTAVGGVGGAIIGSLAGGRIADLFTGANRRRRFEEQRTIVRTQKTLFSDALDDFDKVLDKFEDVAPALVLRRGDDEEEGAAGSRRPPLPIPFFKRPAVRKTGQVLTVAALLSLLALSAKKGKVDQKTYTKILEKVIARRPFLKKLSEKEQVAAIGRIIMRELPKSAQTKVRINASPFLNKRGTVVPGQKGAPGKIRKKTNIVKRNIERKKQEELARKQEELVDKLFSKTPEGQLQNILQKTGLRDPVRMFKKMKSGFEQNAEDVLNLFGRGKISKVQKDNALNILKGNKLIRERQLKQYIRELRKFNRENPNLDLTKQADRQKFNEFYKRLDIFKPDNLPKFDADKLRMKNVDIEIQRNMESIINSRPLRDFIENPGPKVKGSELSFNDLEPPDSTKLALANRGNIFMINQAPSNQVNIIEDTNDIAMIGGTENSFTALNKYAELTSVAFTT